MIYKDADENIVVQFGYGTVHIFSGIIKDEENVPFIGLKNGTPLPVGKRINRLHYPDLDDVKPETYLSFANVKSIEVLIRELENLKQYVQINKLIP